MNIYIRFTVLSVGRCNFPLITAAEFISFTDKQQTGFLYSMYQVTTDTPFKR